MLTTVCGLFVLSWRTTCEYMCMQRNATQRITLLLFTQLCCAAPNHSSIAEETASSMWYIHTTSITNLIAATCSKIRRVYAAETGIALESHREVTCKEFISLNSSRHGHNRSRIQRVCPPPPQKLEVSRTISNPAFCEIPWAFWTELHCFSLPLFQLLSLLFLIFFLSFRSCFLFPFIYLCLLRVFSFFFSCEIFCLSYSFYRLVEVFVRLHCWSVSG